MNRSSTSVTFCLQEVAGLLRYEVVQRGGDQEEVAVLVGVVHQLHTVVALPGGGTGVVVEENVLLVDVLVLVVVGVGDVGHGLEVHGTK
jgi:hypothetical protein